MADNIFQQQLLDLKFETKFTEEGFFVSNSNRYAYEWIKRWPDWPRTMLAFYGPVGCGKTHLASLWKNKSKAYFVSLEDYTSMLPIALLEKAENFIIENPNKIAESYLLHFYNLALEKKKNVLFVAQHPPIEWDVKLPDLKSRLSSLPAVSIDLPDDELLSHIIYKIFNDYQVKVNENVVRFLLTHCERSFIGIQNSVHSIFKYANMKSKNISLNLVAEWMNKNIMV